jgi:hypothetical protein
MASLFGDYLFLKNVCHCHCVIVHALVFALVLSRHSRASSQGRAYVIQLLNDEGLKDMGPIPYFYSKLYDMVKGGPKRWNLCGVTKCDTSVLSAQLWYV